MIYIVGDIHFSAANDWKLNIGGNVVKWFKERFKNCNNDTVIFLGDIVDNYINPGEIVRQVDDLFNFCSKNFKQTYIITGNHDVNYFHHKKDNFLKFVGESYDNVSLIEEIESAVIENKSFLFMPHQMLNDTQSLAHYYSNIDWNEQLKSSNIKEFDYALGHWVIYKEGGSVFLNRVGVDTSNIPAKNFICGHIHTRVDKNYTGSVYPCNPSEVSDDRVIFIIDGDSLKEEQLPKFVEYKEIHYPNMPRKSLEDNKYLTTVYTVYNIYSETEARNFYKDMFIKEVKLFPKSAEKEEVKTENTSLETVDVDSIIKDFFDSSSMDEAVYQVVKETLEKTKRLNFKGDNSLESNKVKFSDEPGFFKKLETL